MEGLNESGVSDLVVVAVMFILLILSSTFLLGFEFGGLETAADRQMEAKVSHFHRTLERSEVRPGITCLEAIAEQLVLEKPRVKEEYLRSWLENTMKFLVPNNHGVEIIMRWREAIWEENYRKSEQRGENFLREGTVLLIASGGELVSVNFKVRVFEIFDQ